MKSRSTTVIAVRVPDSLETRIKDLADKQGLTVSEWCKAVLLRAAGMILAKEQRVDIGLRSSQTLPISSLFLYQGSCETPELNLRQSDN